ncbi:hypothetical protein QZM43_09740 [Burkholderia orbicola]|uniref:hypothetical protein n=1 Tax=Burkholderia orbicola TaxID=2978683 RepID=UPI002650EDFC|nr:hypothetical protein [Burkholderia orbicola]ELW9447685.1 hypothetical protein [Burkholderia cenocepacia]MDN7467416.1 hypothetical protein [Burkholderia orbicola]MDN7503006.1 hypothetical protein [Burkholderia orbicola]
MKRFIRSAGAALALLVVGAVHAQSSSDLLSGLAGRLAQNVTTQSLNVSAGTNIPTVGVDVRLYGAKTDGTTDSGAAINSCLASNSVCVIPPSQNGVYVSTPVAVPDSKWLIGTVGTGVNSSSSFAYPGTSWITCNNTTAQNCVTWGSVAGLASGGVRNLVIAGKAGTPATGSKGLVFAGGYNVQIDDVQVANFDTCIEFDQGLNGVGKNNSTQSCKTHNWVFNAWAGFSEFGGRSGNNGAGNYGAQDNVYFTSSLGAGGGGTGPNSIDFVGYYFNNDNTACAFRWGNYTVTPGAATDYRFLNIYKEPLGSGSSVFCSDSSVHEIQGVSLENSYISQDTGPADLMSGLNAATELTRWVIAHNRLYVGAATAAPTATPGNAPGFNDVKFIGNWMPATTLTPGGGTLRQDKFTSIGNYYNGALTINQGANGWFSMVSIDQGQSITNNSDKYSNLIMWPGKVMTIPTTTNISGDVTATGNGAMPLFDASGNAQNGAHMVRGSVALSSGSATVTFGGSAVFSANNYMCTAVDGTSAAAVALHQVSSSSITLNGTGSDIVQYLCAGK